MFSIIRIAFRNVRLGRKRSRKLSVSIFVAVFLLLFISAAVNGIQDQMLKGYRNIQTGDLIVMWDSLVNTNHGDTQRFINLYKSLSFDDDLKDKNEKNIESVHDYIEQSDQIKNAYPVIRRNASVKADGVSDGAFIVYGFTKEDAEQILDEKILEVEAGSLFSTEGICINRSKAENLELEVGDNVEICAKTQAGEMNYYETKVTGIYSGGAFYDTYYAFIALDTAESIFEIEDGYFDVLKVFLKDLSKAEYEAEEMNRVLDNEVMTVETYSEANTFYTTMPSVIKLVCVAFTLFLLVLIAIGLRSTIRINLMQRMKEFGTIRAIGFSRMQTYGIIFTETFIISFFAFTVALTVVLALLFVVGIQGIYVGPAMSTVFGSERLYPYLNVIDVLETFGVIILFSLMATLKPGLQMCYQNITDILGMKVERIHLLRKIILQK